MSDIKIGLLMNDDSGSKYEIRKDKPDYFKMKNGLYAVRIDNDSNQQEITALKAQINAIKDGLLHFNRSHGDLNPLLTACIDAQYQCLTSVRVDTVATFVKYAVHDDVKNKSLESWLNLMAENFANRIK
jgi:hypothetical protein